MSAIHRTKDSDETQGACDQKTLFEILVRAASSEDSIESTAKILKKILAGNNIRYHLEKIDNFEVLEKQINQALKSRIPQGIIKGHLKINTVQLRKIVGWVERSCYPTKPRECWVSFLKRQFPKEGFPPSGLAPQPTHSSGF